MPRPNPTPIETEENEYLPTEVAGPSTDEPANLLTVEPKEATHHTLKEMLDDPALIDSAAYGRLKARKLMAFADLPNDPGSNLLGNRWLEKKSMAVLFAPSGVGKTSAVLQASALWALGKPAFEIKPERALRILIIQAEDTDLDIRDPVAGTRQGCNLTKKDCAAINERVVVVSSRSNGLEFMREVLLPAIQQNDPDLVILNPLFAYKDGDADLTRQNDAGEFIRHQLLTVAEKMNVGILGVHHTNKPGNTDWAEMKEFTLQYAMASSADIANAARAVLAILPVEDGIHAIAGAKRWQKLGWTKEEPRGEDDPSDKPSTLYPVSRNYYRHVCYGENSYAWEKADERDIRREKRGVDEKYDDSTLLKPFDLKNPLTMTEWLAALNGKCNISSKALYVRANKFIADGHMEKAGRGLFKRTSDVDLEV